MTRLGRSLFAAALLALSLSAAGCAAKWIDHRPDEVVIAGEEVVLPFRWYGTLPVLEVLVDGEGPFSFLVDTGSTFSIVSPGIAAGHCEGAFPLDEPMPIATPDGGSCVVSEAIPVISLRAGSAEFRMFAAVVLDLDGVSGALGFRVDGVLGYSVFSTGLLTLDYPRKEVRFARGELPAIDGLSIVPLFEQGIPCVDLDWRGTPLRVTLDSGSNGGFVLGEWPEGAKILSTATRGKGGITLLGQRERSSCGRIRGALEFGGRRVLDPIISLTKGPPRIGTDVFGKCCLTLDPAHGKLRILGGPLEWRNAPLRSSGAYVRAFKGSFTINDVLPGSPAETKGVHVGDVVLAWDGIPADAEHQVELVLGHHSNGTTERFTLRRDDRTIEVEIPLFDLVP